MLPPGSGLCPGRGSARGERGGWRGARRAGPAEGERERGAGEGGRGWRAEEGSRVSPRGRAAVAGRGEGEDGSVMVTAGREAEEEASKMAGAIVAVVVMRGDD